MDQEQSALQPTPRNARRWPGILVSAMVPGFGLYRSGLGARGLFWFVYLCVLQISATLAVVLKGIPVYVGIGLYVLLLLSMLVMLKDSFRPGRMTVSSWVLFVISAIGTCFLVNRPILHILRTFRIPTVSMEPTLCSGDCVIVNTFAYRLGPIKRGDLVVFRAAGIANFHENVYWIKRVIAFAGETVSLHNGAIFINGTKMSVADGIPPLKYAPMPMLDSILSSSWPSYKVPDGKIFVLGDDPTKSDDSRDWGGIPIGNVYGQVTKIYYPFSRMGTVR